MLKTLLSPWSDRVYAAIRIVTGLMFSFHGMQKTFGLLAKERMPLNSQAGIGGVIELVTGLLIAVGLFTRCAAFLASGTMAVAYWQFHVFASKIEGIQKFIPAINQGTAAALFCFWFLYMACNGAGPWSLDAKRAPPHLSSGRECPTGERLYPLPWNYSFSGRGSEAIGPRGAGCFAG